MGLWCMCSLRCRRCRSKAGSREEGVGSRKDGPSLWRRAVCFKGGLVDEDSEAAGAVDAADAGHFDVAGGGGAGDGGDGEAGVGEDGGEGFGEVLEDLVAADDADVVVGEKGDEAAALRSLMDEDDGAGGSDGGFAGGDDGLGDADFFDGEIAVEDWRDGGGEPGGGEGRGGDELGFAGGGEDLCDGRGDGVGGGEDVDFGVVVGEAVEEELEAGFRREAADAVVGCRDEGVRGGGVGGLRA